MIPQNLPENFSHVNKHSLNSRADRYSRIILIRARIQLLVECLFKYSYQFLPLYKPTKENYFKYSVDISDQIANIHHINGKQRSKPTQTGILTMNIIKAHRSRNAARSFAASSQGRVIDLTAKAAQKEFSVYALSVAHKQGVRWVTVPKEAVLKPTKPSVQALLKYHQVGGYQYDAKRVPVISVSV